MSTRAAGKSSIRHFSLSYLILIPHHPVNLVTLPPSSREAAVHVAYLALVQAQDRESFAAAVRQVCRAELGDGSYRVLTASEFVQRRGGDASKAAAELVSGEPLTDEFGLLLPLRGNDLHASALDLRPYHVYMGWQASARRCAELIEARWVSLVALGRLQGSVVRLEQAERLQRALYAIADQASSDHEMSDVLCAMHAIVGSLMYAENFYLVLYDAEHGAVRFVYFVDVADKDVPDPARDIPMIEMRHSLTWYLLSLGQPLRGGLAALEAQIEGPIEAFGPDCVDWLGVPLVRGGQVVGGIVVQSYSEKARFSEQDQTLLTYVAQHILTALERRRAHVELERRVAERTDALREANRVLQQQVVERQRGERLQSALFRIAELANTTESLDEFYAAVHRVVGGLLYARNFYIALLSENQDLLDFPYSVDERDPHRESRRLGKGLTEYVLLHRRALLLDRDGIERLYACGEAVSSGTRSICWLGVPLVCADKAVGVLAVQSYSDRYHYTARDQELLTFVSYHIANALERKRSAESLKRAYSELEQRVAERTAELAAANRDLRRQIIFRESIERQLKHETLHDALTGLPNRNLLLERLELALERYRTDPRRLFAVLFLDLDRFKVINDSVGHLVGDDLLYEVGGRIARCLDPLDVVARLGGDEFAILVQDIADVDRVCMLAQRVIDALNAPIRLGAKEVFTSASIGIALASSRYTKAEELLRDADVAMYRAKDEGRHRFALFDERLHQQALRLLETENDLKRAIGRGELVPYFQPIVRLSDRHIVGFEALVRWLHPERGLLLPGEFLGVAEDSGSAEQIDWLMFERVCALTPTLTACGGFISINLSGRHFRSKDLDRKLFETIDRHGIAQACIRIEVTERVLLEDPVRVKEILSSLRQRGLSVALDDFGTGYSSLSYLHQYPLQALKIDRSFVAGLTPENGSSNAVVRAIKALAGSLDMQVIAEGIETETQCYALQSIGCEFGQGFLFGEPQPAEYWINVGIV